MLKLITKRSKWGLYPAILDDQGNEYKTTYINYEATVGSSPTLTVEFLVDENIEVDLDVLENEVIDRNKIEHEDS